MRFPLPPYIVIDIAEDAPVDVKEYALGKIRKLGIPRLEKDRIGVTIRVSMPGALDKRSKHGGLHVTGEREILKRVLEKYEQYKPGGKIIVQHTVDARCSGTILKENHYITVEAIFGDAPPLLEGRTTKYETWIFDLHYRKWKKEKAYIRADEEVTVLTFEDVSALEKYAKTVNSNTYLEWSIAKNGKLYFYEYLVLERTR